ncbi:hypothetical protein J7M22_07855 [Candidatus Poribacteria bacterium]|nr:hypothetical protein [Candidatus Poribacteria bacterium]
MTRRLALPLLILTAVLSLAGCAAKPQITALIEPVPTGKELRIDERTGAITVEKEDIAITIRPLDTRELMALTDDIDINPYIEKGFWGKVRPLYTVFDLSIHNKSRNKVVVDPIAQLITENGDQYASLPYEYFKDILGTVYGRKVIVYVPVRYRWWYDPYWDVWYYKPYWRPWGYRYPWYGWPYYCTRTVSHDELRALRAVVRDTIFDGAKLFPGARRHGLLVFEPIPGDVSEFRLIIPEVRIYRRGRGRPRRIDFQFHFKQRVLVR